jgi:two-component system, OmpR family, response regulator ResD
MKKILLINDDGSSKRIILDNLNKEDDIIVEASDRKNAWKLLEKRDSYHLIIIDIVSMDTNTWAACREIKRVTHAPVIILCSTNDDIYELYSFELGIDDFIRKPFNPQILIARIKAILKRGTCTVGNTFQFNEIELDVTGHNVFFKGKPLRLRPKEYDLLKYLIEHREIALKREQILQNVWNYDYTGYQRTIDSHIKKLRRKLGEKCSYI